MVHKHQNKYTLISQHVWNFIYVLSTREEMKILGIYMADTVTLVRHVGTNTTPNSKLAQISIL